MIRFSYTKYSSIIIFVLLAASTLGNYSCSQKIYPSGLEGNLFSYQGNFHREQSKRQRVAARTKRQSARLERQARKPIIKKEKDTQKLHKQLYKEHVARQDPHVQERMKQNLKESKKNNPPRSTLLKKLVFWKKIKCPHGS